MVVVREGGRADSTAAGFALCLAKSHQAGYEMCYSAQIWADFKKYERLGGMLDVHAFSRVFFERGRKGDFIQLVPRAMRDAFIYQHGVVVASRFYESVNLHENQHRQLAPGEREQSIEIAFTPEPKQEMFLACLWRFVELEGDQPSFYGFAAITRDPPPEVLDAGHDRCVICLKPENIDAWLEPHPTNLPAMYAILDDPIDAYYQHELSPRKGDSFR
jgi:hypothetical protein